jgi:hypothetical protein
MIHGRLRVYLDRMINALPPVATCPLQPLSRPVGCVGPQPLSPGTHHLPLNSLRPVTTHLVGGGSSASGAMITSPPALHPGSVIHPASKTPLKIQVRSSLLVGVGCSVWLSRGKQITRLWRCIRPAENPLHAFQLSSCSTVSAYIGHLA